MTSKPASATGDREYLEDDPEMVAWSPSLITLEGLRIDPADVVQFLARLAVTGNVLDACKKSRIGRSTVYRMREHISEFRVAWDRAIEMSHDVLRRELFRRAVEGVPKPIVHNGKVIGTIREYSDQLLALLGKGHLPELAKTIQSNTMLQVQGQQANALATSAAGGGAIGPPVPPVHDYVDPVTGRKCQGLLAGIKKLGALADELVGDDGEEPTT